MLTAKHLENLLVYENGFFFRNIILIIVLCAADIIARFSSFEVG